MDKRRLIDILGVVLMGDAVVNVMGGKKHVRLWRSRGGEKSLYNRASEYLGNHPLAYGLVAAAEFALGALLTRRAERPAS